MHLGLEKCGSTTIQAGLRANRRALGKANLRVPRSVGFPNATRLAAFASEFRQTQRLVHRWQGVNSADELEQYRNRFRAELIEEVEGAPARLSFICSSEHLTSQVRDEDEIHRLSGLLHETFDEVECLIVIRRQDLLCLSRYSQALRAGRKRTFAFRPVHFFDLSLIHI